MAARRSPALAHGVQRCPARPRHAGGSDEGCRASFRTPRSWTKHSLYLSRASQPTPMCTRRSDRVVPRWAVGGQSPWPHAVPDTAKSCLRPRQSACPSCPPCSPRHGWCGHRALSPGTTQSIQGPQRTGNPEAACAVQCRVTKTDAQARVSSPAVGPCGIMPSRMQPRRRHHEASTDGTRTEDAHAIRHTRRSGQGRTERVPCQGRRTRHVAQKLRSYMADRRQEDRPKGARDMETPGEPAPYSAVPSGARRSRSQGSASRPQSRARPHPCGRWPQEGIPSVVVR